ncbi:hypothetical protein MNV49_002589 [Pseudohyphozyma bogoriensis]|nr:hypothetical protein MNV49_002589 [Pseudohyphozyma bogoriensis]
MSSAARRLVVVGLGNYSKELSRHSAGQEVLASLVNIASSRAGKKTPPKLALDLTKTAWYTKVNVPASANNDDGFSVTFIKPRTEMNNIAQAMKRLSSSPPYIVPPYLQIRDLFVIHDELRGLTNSFRIQTGPTKRERHNGVLGMEDHFGTGFRRVQVGIGKSREKSYGTRYVMEALGYRELWALQWDPEERVKARMVEEVWSEVERIPEAKVAAKETLVCG